MSKQFATIKKKRILSAILHSVTFALSCGLLVVGAVLLPLKICKIDLAWWYYLIIGIGVALISFSTLLLFIFPRNKRLAKQLDKKYALNERVQTLIEYSSNTGAMATLQRQDAEEKLLNLPKKPLDVKKILLNLIVPIISVAIFITAIAIPKAVEPQPEPYKPPVIDIGKIEKNQLENLIDNITASNLPSDLKASYLQELNTLLENTSKKITEDERTAYGLSSLNAIITLTANYTTFEEAVSSLDGAFTLMSEAVNSGALYYTALGENDLVNYSAISGLTSEIEKTTDAMFRNTVNQLIADLFQDIEGEETEDWAKFTLAFAGANTSLSASLENVPNGELKVALQTLRQILGKWGTKNATDGYSLAAIKTQLSIDLTNNFRGLISQEISKQAYVKLIERHTVLVLANIFGLEVPEKDEVKEDAPFKPGTPPKDTTDTDEKVYPSQNELYDKNSEAYKHYVDVYEQYSGNISQILNDENVPPELMQIIRTFYENFQKTE